MGRLIITATPWGTIMGQGRNIYGHEIKGPVTEGNLVVKIFEFLLGQFF